MAKPAKYQRSLKTVVGEETYSVWVSMLRILVPEGRTHRVAPLVAGMLQYALSRADGQDQHDAVEDSVAQSLIDSAESMEVTEVAELLNDVMIQLFKDAGARYARTSARGEGYSILESIYYEYLHWFDMPWEA
nr:hypothetical protein [Anaerolineae bacterium]